MPAFVALLRAINVGGRNMVRMDALKALHESLGFEGVRTVLQSGNVVFRTKRTDPAKLERRIEHAIRETLELDLTVVVRESGELRNVVSANPLPHRAAEANRLLVVFLSAEPQDAGALDSYAGPEEKQLLGRELYVYYGAGMAGTKLSNALIERKLGVKGTARNWNTVNKLMELTASLESGA